MAKFGDGVKKKVGKSYNPENQCIEDAQYLYLPDSSTQDWPKTVYKTPKEIALKQKSSKKRR
jgi:hypothetical protein